MGNFIVSDSVFLVVYGKLVHYTSVPSSILYNELYLLWVSESNLQYFLKSYGT